MKADDFIKCQGGVYYDATLINGNTVKVYKLAGKQAFCNATDCKTEYPIDQIKGVVKIDK